MPKKLGVEATASNANDLKLQKANEAKIAKELLEQAQAFAEDIKEKFVTVTIKTGEGGRTFGSVSTKEIAAAAKAQLGIDIDKKKLQVAAADSHARRDNCAVQGTSKGYGTAYS